MTIVSPPGLPPRVRKKQERAREKFGQDAGCKHGYSPIFGNRQTNERHDRDSNEEEN